MTSFASPQFAHIVSYGTLLGSQIFQTFINGIVAFRVLPRPQFSQLQQALFPIYFGMQTALPVVLALTFPGQRPSPEIAYSLESRVSGLTGVLLEKNRLNVLLPIVTMFATSLANWAVVGPATTRIMRERKHQETRDGKRSYDAPPHSKQMMRLNKSFGRLHGSSSLLNVIGLVAIFWYSGVIAKSMS